MAELETRPAARRKTPRKISPRYLENAALFHLKRYSTSVKQLRRVLLRKTARSMRHHGGDKAQATGWIDELLVKLQRNGLLNDESFAKNRAHSLRASGKSSRMITMKLREKGVSSEHVQHAVKDATSEVSEEDAAFRHAQRRRLGPYRAAALRKERREKDLAALARAGFSFAIARKVIDSQVE
ncbi:MAG: regulatory protein RecX [Myxococcaceae bacterium]